MKAEYLIKSVREAVNELWDSYLLYVESDGKHGLNCFNPDVMLAKVNRTDIEILEEATNKGIYIIDKDEYIAKLKEAGM